MAKLFGPDFLSLQVRNFSVSRAFYTELLELPVDERFDTADFVRFDTTTIPLALTAATVTLAEVPSSSLTRMAYRITANQNLWDRFPLGGRQPQRL